MAARESQTREVDYFSADANSRGEMPEKEPAPYQKPLKPFPPVALSLRARESAALDCKHIFDQIYSSAESNSNINNNDKSNSLKATERSTSDCQAYKRDTSNAALQSGRIVTDPQNWQVNNSSEEHRGAPETEPSFTKVQPQNFSSHISALTLPPLARLSSQTHHNPVQPATLSQVFSRPSLANASMKQPTSQLTIFYSGTVNVYDDVPADRANAIMLLAGNGNPLPLKQSNDGNKEFTSAKLKPNSPAPAPCPLIVHTSKVLGCAPNVSPALPSICERIRLKAPPTVNALINPAASSPSLEPRPQAGTKRAHSHIELPHSRKASLARFLEKRKDRVQVKQQQGDATSRIEENIDQNNEGMLLSPRVSPDRVVFNSSQMTLK